MFVLSIGLLGVAAMIPVGRFGIVEAAKADRSEACGRAALAEIKTRGMLQYGQWANPASPPAWWNAVLNPLDAPPTVSALQAFAIDPLGRARGLTGNLGGGAAPIPRITLTYVGNNLPLAERIFTWHDDLEFSRPEQMKPRPDTESTRPRPADASGIPQSAGHFSWLITVTPAAVEAGLAVDAKTLYRVSVVVCYRRDFATGGEHTADVAFLGPGYGGGSVRLSGWAPVDPPLKVRENEWIMLCGVDSAGRTVCHWYRVVAADSGDPTEYLSLVGPDWSIDSDNNGQLDATAVTIDRVAGVYTTTVELDRSLLWNK